jgi:AcrR family transcriptional regulator
MRADGRRNRQLVLDAAVALFGEEGLKVPIEQIAQRAGVGVGTVCRHFPTKEALIDAALASLWEEGLARARAAHADPDAGRAFATFVTSLAEFQSCHRGLSEEMAAAIDVPTSTQQIKETVRSVVTEIVERAKADGSLRADIGTTDVSLLIAGIAHVASLSGVDPVLRDRYITVMLDGLRPPGASPLPGRPLSFAELDRLRARGTGASRPS